MNMAARHRTFSPDMGMPAKRELPSSMEAEQALLGAIFINDAVMDVIPPALDERHFDEPLNGAIFREMKRIRSAGKGISPISIKFAVTDAPAQVGGLTFAQYLSRLASDAVSVINAPDYAAAILDAAQRRELIGLSQKLEAIAFEHELEIPDDIKAIEDRLAEVRSERIGGAEGESYADIVDETLDKTDDAARGREPSGLDPGIPEIVSLTGLWEPGQLIVIGGDVKTGKSALAWQTFFNIAEHHPVGGFSGEMPTAQIVRREKARRTGISDKRQRRGQVSGIEMEELVRAGAEMKRLKHIDIECRQLTLEQIDARITRLISDHGIQAYFVDHLLKLSWNGKMEDVDDHKKASRATSMLKNMAMKHNIPIIALTHVNKSWTSGTYGRSFADNLRTAQRRRPTFKDMLGNIDKDADNMIIVHQTLPAITALEPEENTADHELWKTAMEESQGRVQIILALSRENEFPRRKDIEWHGETTSYGPPFKRAHNEGRRLI